ncbi:MAG: selenite/tellurite reduction operon protein ExtJ [Thermodesulfobacteriota bacterium]
MSKKLLTLALAAVFLASTASVSLAAKIKCTVDSVEGDKVTMTCSGADDLKAGDNVEVKAKKGKAIEGC